MMEGRAEMKYALPLARRAEVLEAAAGHITPDTHAANLAELLPGLRGPQGEDPFGYRVSSIYLDTPTLHGYNERLARQRVRNRVRVRSYGFSGQPAPVYLEAKRKLADRVIKHRAKLGDARAWEGADSERPWVELCAGAPPNSVTARWLQAVEGPGMVPVCRVSYVRETWCEGNSRLTMDHHVGAAPEPDGRDLRGPCPVPLIPPDWFVLELKFDTTEPPWMLRLVRSLRLAAEPVSKFALGVVLTLRPDKAHERRVLTPPSLLRVPDAAR
jgi:hypothetical protein